MNGIPNVPPINIPGGWSIFAYVYHCNNPVISNFDTCRQKAYMECRVCGKRIYDIEFLIGLTEGGDTCEAEHDPCIAKSENDMYVQSNKQYFSEDFRKVRDSVNSIIAGCRKKRRRDGIQEI